MENKTRIDQLLGELPGSRVLTALELNDIRFSGHKTVITPTRLRRSSSDKKAKSVNQ